MTEDELNSPDNTVCSPEPIMVTHWRNPEILNVLNTNGADEAVDRCQAPAEVCPTTGGDVWDTDRNLGNGGAGAPETEDNCENFVGVNAFEADCMGHITFVNP